VEDNLVTVPIVLNVNIATPPRRSMPKCLAPEARSVKRWVQAPAVF
jgi:hypothetical protein